MLLLTLGGIATGDAVAEVYRWIDAEGVVHYTDKPPKRGSRPVTLPPLQLISGDGPPAAPIPEGFPLRLTTPSPDASFGATHTIEAKVALGRTPPAGSGLLFLLDGNPSNTTPQNPQSAASYRFQGISRGAHFVGASLVDRSGRELGRAVPVIVHVGDGAAAAAAPQKSAP